MTPTAPTVTVNGVERPLTDPVSVAALVTELLADDAGTPVSAPTGGGLDGGLDGGTANDHAPNGVAVAVDDAIVPRGLWDSTLVRAGARVEVVTAVQGG
jgi:sulfur carrier protein